MNYPGISSRWGGARVLIGGLVLGLLALTGCGGASSGASKNGAAGPRGEPVSGGVLRAMMVSEPRTLDPATIINTGGLGDVVANAVFGTLITNNSETGKVEYVMAESLASADGGTTWRLKLREGIEYSDGTPMDAADVKFAWERIGDPQVGAPVASIIRNDIASMKVVDDLTLEFVLTAPQVRFDGVLLTSALNWVAKPEALRRGTAAFDRQPIGAGPFKLKSWHRGGAIELVRNEKYFDAPRPYLDGMTITTVPDPDQRVDSLIGDNADLLPASNPAVRDKGAKAGLQVHQHPINGGNVMLLNSTTPPFDDIRAREAVVKAVDQQALNAAVTRGKGEVVKSVFDVKDPLHSGVEIQRHDPERAQGLFDELAAEGKPLEFTISAAIAPEIAEAVQAQLSSFENVTVQVRKLEAADSTTKLLDASYQALTNGAPFAIADNTLHTWFHPDSAMHPGRPDNPELAKLIERGRATRDETERKDIWQQVEQKIADSYAMLWTTRPERAYLAATDVGGVETYGAGSVAVAGLWLAK